MWCTGSHCQWLLHRRWRHLDSVLFASCVSLYARAVPRLTAPGCIAFMSVQWSNDTIIKIFHNWMCRHEIPVRMQFFLSTHNANVHISEENDNVTSFPCALVSIGAHERDFCTGMRLERPEVANPDCCLEKRQRHGPASPALLYQRCLL